MTGGPHFRDVVVGILREAHVPLCDPHQARSGIVVSGNGRAIRVIMVAADGGDKRPGIWAAWFLVAVELLRDAGFPVAADPTKVTASVGAPPMRQLKEEVCHD